MDWIKRTKESKARSMVSKNIDLQALLRQNQNMIKPNLSNKAGKFESDELILKNNMILHNITIYWCRTLNQPSAPEFHNS